MLLFLLKYKNYNYRFCSAKKYVGTRWHVFDWLNAAKLCLIFVIIIRKKTFN